MNRGSSGYPRPEVERERASMRPRFMNRGSTIPPDGDVLRISPELQ